jgi:hypothetical protein
VVELVRIARRLVLLFRPILGLLILMAGLALVIPISDSLWAERLIGAGMVHTGQWTPEDHGCTHTPGYWKNHPEAWPQDQIEIGGVVYLDAEAIAVLETPPQGDATYVLAHQLIAATVNVLAGADEEAVEGTIQQANAWLEAQPLGSDPSNPERGQGVEFADALTDYNEGRTGPGPCEEEAGNDTPTITATETSTATATPTAPATDTETPTPSATAGARGPSADTATPTPTASDTPEASPTDLPTATLEPSDEPTATPEMAPSETPEPPPTDTPEPPPPEPPGPEPPA